MNIVYFLPRLESCGPANVVLNNVRELISLEPNINIKIVSYRDNLDSKEFENAFRKLGIKEIYCLDSDRHTRPFTKLKYLRKITKNVDIIHSNGFFPDLFTSILSTRLVKFSTAHSIISQDYPATYGTLKGTLYALLHHGVYLNPSFDRIIACSEEVESHIKKYSIFNRDKITTIHNGINRNYYSKLDLESKNILKSKILNSIGINYNSDTKVFIYSGRLTRLKRVPELIEWFIKLADFNNVLIILGDGDEREICEKVAGGSKNIFFQGFVDETTPYYQVSDYVVSNSSLEGFPMGILEGMSCGCMALLSDIPAHREIIRYFPNIATLLVNFNSNRTATNATKKELFYLSATRMADLYLSVYKKSLNLKANVE